MPCLYYNKTRFSVTKTIKNAQIKYKFEPVIRIDTCYQRHEVPILDTRAAEGGDT
jgi:hypothetical protein